MAVCSSVHLYVLGIYHIFPNWMEFCEIWYWELLWNSVEKIQMWLKFHINKGSLHKNLSTFFWCLWHKVTIKNYWQWHAVKRESCLCTMNSFPSLPWYKGENWSTQQFYIKQYMTMSHQKVCYVTTANTALYEVWTGSLHI